MFISKVTEVEETGSGNNLEGPKRGPWSLGEERARKMHPRGGRRERHKSLHGESCYQGSS